MNSDYCCDFARRPEGKTLLRTLVGRSQTLSPVAAAMTTLTIMPPQNRITQDDERHEAVMTASVRIQRRLGESAKIRRSKEHC
jgi:hypothetical protein